jgi:hypothetical protein
MYLVLIGVQNRTFSPCLAAIYRILVSVTAKDSAHCQLVHLIIGIDFLLSNAHLIIGIDFVLLKAHLIIGIDLVPFTVHLTIGTHDEG